MSILLESLNQSKQVSATEPGKGVPNVGDSHFDDEMLSDEWLLKKLMFWKIISGLLLIVLLTSWAGFYFYSVKSESLYNQGSAEISSDKKNVKLQPQIENVDIDNTSKRELLSSNNDDGESGDIKNDEIEQAGKIEMPVDEVNKSGTAPTKIKEQYKPKKIQKTTGDGVTKQLVSSETNQENFSVHNDQPVNFESLTESEKQQLPELEISSYAVSSNAKKSFVVLNGSFYGQGETIAPHLILISIDKEGILIRYKAKLIRKKYHM